MPKTKKVGPSKKGKKISRKNKTQMGGNLNTQFMDAINNADLEYIQSNIKQLEDLSFENKDGNTPLGIAVDRYNDLETTEFMGNYERKLYSIRTQIIEILLENGANGGNIEIPGINLNKAYLKGVNLVEANLEGANLEDSNLVGANLEGANLKGVNLKWANLEDSNLVGANLEGAKLKRADLVEANLEGANLEGADLEGAELEVANLVGANLVEANLEESSLEGADLEGANLKGANLEGANLKEANLKRANLEGANLEGANLKRANLKEANLVGANLEGANLEGANLEGAELEEANLEGAAMDGAIFEESNLEEEIFNTQSPSNVFHVLHKTERNERLKRERNEKKQKYLQRPEITLNINNTNPFEKVGLSSYHVFEMEDVNFCDYIREDQDNVIFIYDKQVGMFDKSTIRKLITTETLDETKIVYECNEISEAFVPYEENIISGPMLNMRILAINGLMIPLNELDAVVNVEHQIFVIETENDKNKIPIASLPTRLAMGDDESGRAVVSADHCQEEVLIKVGKLSYIENRVLLDQCPILVGKGKPKKTERKKNKTKRIRRKKTKCSRKNKKDNKKTSKK
jgi:uncharacterized protein YjbI with pentapeptide repeats